MLQTLELCFLLSGSLPFLTSTSSVSFLSPYLIQLCVHSTCTDEPSSALTLPAYTELSLYPLLFCGPYLASFPGLHAQLLLLAVRKAGEGLDGFIT